MVLHHLRMRWAAMDSVILNNTLQEDWQARPDSNNRWSHCAVGVQHVIGKHEERIPR